MMCEESVKSDQKSVTTVIFAAGGIVWKHSSHGPEVAVIHRTRYGGEWCLPKGKPDPDKDETWEEIARREVKEETGCDAKITSFAGTTGYMVDDTPKVVLFWNMEIEGKCSFKPSEEVDKVEWLKSKKAIDRLDHIEEKNLLTKAYYGRIPFSRLRLFSWFKSRRYHRLAGALIAYRTELEHRICLTRENNQSNRCWVYAARKLLAQAECALYENNIDKGWKSFLAAQRVELFGLNPDKELKTKVIVLREESEKLRAWRKKATEKLLGIKDDEVPDVENVYQAALLRDEHFSNQAYKDGLARSHVLRLATILAVIILLLLWLVRQGYMPLDVSSSSSNLWMLISVALFGLLGGTISAIFKAQDSTQSARIPEMVSTTRLMMLRLFTGTASAIVIYIFLQSRLKDIFDFLKNVTLQPHTIFAISFVSGFTERLVLRAVSYVAGK